MPALRYASRKRLCNYVSIMKISVRKQKHRSVFITPIRPAFIWHRIVKICVNVDAGILMNQRFFKLGSIR